MPFIVRCCFFTCFVSLRSQVVIDGNCYFDIFTLSLTVPLYYFRLCCKYFNDLCLASRKPLSFPKASAKLTPFSEPAKLFARFFAVFLHSPAQRSVSQHLTTESFFRRFPLTCGNAPFRAARLSTITVKQKRPKITSTAFGYFKF